MRITFNGGICAIPIVLTLNKVCQQDSENPEWRCFISVCFRNWTCVYCMFSTYCVSLSPIFFLFRWPTWYRKYYAALLVLSLPKQCWLYTMEVEAWMVGGIDTHNAPHIDDTLYFGIPHPPVTERERKKMGTYFGCDFPPTPPWPWPSLPPSCRPPTSMSLRAVDTPSQPWPEWGRTRGTGGRLIAFKMWGYYLNSSPLHLLELLCSLLILQLMFLPSQVIVFFIYF